MSYDIHDMFIHVLYILKIDGYINIYIYINNTYYILYYLTKEMTPINIPGHCIFFLQLFCTLFLIPADGMGTVQSLTVSS